MILLSKHYSNKVSNSLISLLLVLLFVYPSTPATANELDKEMVKVSIARLPTLAEENKSGVLVDLVYQIDKELGTSSEIYISPFKRAMMRLSREEVDYHIPVIDLLPYSSTPDYILSERTILFDVHFVLYSLQGSGITIDNVAQKARFENSIIVTDQAHTDLFQFPINGTSCIECALKMLDIGRVHAVIFAMAESDSIVKKNGLKNIKKSLFRTFPVHVAFPDKQKMAQYDERLHLAIENLKKKGIYQKIMGQVLRPYSDEF